MASVSLNSTSKSRRNEIDMLHGPLAPKLIRVALPLAAISILQQLFNAADVAVVGRFASDTALAAVGANTPIVNMFLTFFTGLATGGNVALASLIGRGETEKIKKGVQTLYTLALICAVAVVVIGQPLARPLLGAINTPDNCLNSAVLYLRIYLFAMAFAVIYNFASAILRSKGDTKRPLYSLIASGILNVILNLILVIGFHLDVEGVAIATLVANIVNAGIVVFLLMKEAMPFTLNPANLLLESRILKYTLKIGLPTGLQGVLFSFSNILIQSGINSFGSDCIAGNTAACNFEFMAFFVVSAYGQTAATFTSQNYSAGNKKRCRDILLQSILLGMGMTAMISAVFYFGRACWLQIFTTSESVLEYANIRMRYVVALECLTALNEIPSNYLRGKGISIPPTIIAIFATCVLRILWLNTVFAWSHTIRTLMLVYPATWIAADIMMLIALFYYEKVSRGRVL